MSTILSRDDMQSLLDDWRMIAEWSIGLSFEDVAMFSEHEDNGHYFADLSLVVGERDGGWAMLRAYSDGSVQLERSYFGDDVIVTTLVP